MADAGETVAAAGRLTIQQYSAASAGALRLYSLSSRSGKIPGILCVL
jgi:hypothetical protein